MKSQKALPILLPLFFLAVLEAVLFAANYTSGSWLAGWDNVMPELNFRLNFARNLSSVWQEYRGLGLLDGMAHAANLFHTVLLYLMSLVLPANLLRYTFTFLTHFLGGLGVYLLLLTVPVFRKNRAASLAGAVFYLLNPYTVQMYYTPLEAFSVHFAALPWLAYAYIKLLNKGSGKWYLLFLLITLITTPQFFVTPLLLPVLIVLGAISLVNLKKYKRILTALAGFFLINSFWMLPYVYSIPYIGPVIAEAKINQMSTGEIYLRNLEFGDFKSVVLMRGFTLDYLDFDQQAGSIRMMEPIRSYWMSGPVTVLYAMFFIVVLIQILRVIAILIKRNGYRKDAVSQIPWVLMLAAGFFFLGNDVPGLRNLNYLIRDNIPLFGEAFRFAFTKFSLLYAFSYSILLGLAITHLSNFAGTRLRQTRNLIPIILILLVFFGSWPVFGGNFIYRKLRVNIPQEYFSLIDFMKELDPGGRTALLPQYSVWSWKYYNFGLRGSGFLWYGLPQPTMDQAFTPWSGENENYYWELSKAVYAKNAPDLENVLLKYHIRYVILDGNVTTTGNFFTMYTNEIRDTLKSLPRTKNLATVGKIEIYEMSYAEDYGPATISSGLPVVAPSYSFSDYDRAYEELGDYISAPSVNYQLSPINYYYPFRSFFTKRSVDERDFNIRETFSSLTISTVLPENIRQWSVSEATDSADFNISGRTLSVFIEKENNLVFNSTAGKSITKEAVKLCDNIRNGTTSVESGTDNNQAWVRMKAINKRNCISFGLVNEKSPFRLLEHSGGYIVTVTSRHVSGRPLEIALNNVTAKHTELETYLSEDLNWKTGYFILPPLATDGLGYDVYITNDSIGKQETVNDISLIQVFRIPYDYFIGLKLSNNNTFSVYPQSLVISDFQVLHPNASYYKITFEPVTNLPTEASAKAEYSQPATLILNQSFHPGWTAYAIPENSWLAGSIPFLFGRKLENHVLVNNWANGWQLESFDNRPSTTIFCFFPQVLEWLGFILLPLPFICLFTRRSFRA